MTDQVKNDTDDQNTGLSDDELYELEWEEDEDGTDHSDSSDTTQDDTSDDDSTGENVDGKAEEGGPETDQTVDEDSSKDDSGDSSDSSSGTNDDDDIWAGLNEVQRAELKKLQNDQSSAVGRAAAVQRQLSEREKELEAKEAELRAATRTKGNYETEHPELFNEVKDYLEAEGYQKPATQSPQDQDEANADEPDDDVKLVMRAHPDAANLMQTDEWSDFVGNLDGELKDKAQSDDPWDFIDLVNEFKVAQRVSQAQQNVAPQDDEDDSVVVRGKSSQSQTKRGALTADEEYDLEWENDD